MRATGLAGWVAGPPAGPPRVRRPLPYPWSPPRPAPGPPGAHRGPMFQPVTAQARLRRPGARAAPGVGRAADLRPAARPERGRPALELPRRADHRQQPDGRPPRVGPHLQGPVPALPRDAGRGPALPERLRLPGPVGRGQRRARPRLHVASATSRRTASTAFVTPVQAAGPDLRGAPDRAVDPARHVDGLERPGRAAPAARPAGRGPAPAVTTIEGPDGPVTDTVEMLVGRLGHARGRRLVLHVQQREQRPHLGVPRRVPPARLAVQGPRHDAVVPALRHGPVARWR